MFTVYHKFASLAYFMSCKFWEKWNKLIADLINSNDKLMQMSVSDLFSKKKKKKESLVHESKKQNIKH